MSTTETDGTEHREPTMEERATLGMDPPDEQSLLDSLRAAREETSQHKETLISIPGYEESGIDLYAQYKLVSGPDFERIIARVQQRKGGGRQSRWNQNLNAALDVMALACVGIYRQTRFDEEPKPLTYQGTAITGYGDPNLRAALGISEDLETAREVIVAVFCGNDLAVSNHSIKLQRWFSNTGAQVDGELLGETL